jgi:peptide deformylase
MYKIEKGKDNKNLRKKSLEITSFDKELKEVYKGMVDTLIKEGGCGLAGPQVGFPFRIFIILDPRTQKITCFCNPVIKKTSEDICVIEEGCLSLPNL